MQLTKFTHACVRLDDGDRSLVIDPGVFSEVGTALEGAAAVLITHEHADHVDTEKVIAAARRDPRLRVWAAGPAAAALGVLGEQVVAVGPGESFDAAGFAVRTFGGQHALIHPLIPVVANVGFWIEGVYHPGDSFTVPDAPVGTLLLPTNAPWSKASEVIDFAIAVRAPRTFQIHDSLVTPVYAGIVEGHLQRIAGPFGTAFTHLDPGATVTL
ncbi:MAG: MBL fold metallo-hydrolase [Jatrophihabitans sp.]|nr:MAG: MBL fold metallo-hydrolase [Jatrophihabitans sp.]